MDRRIFVLFCAAVLLLAQPAFGQPTVAIQPYIGLGYGPQSVIPLTSGIPVFTQGDDLWAQSYSTSSTMTLILVSPAGTLAPAVNLAPGGLVRVYTFMQSDPSGTWLIHVYTGQMVTQVELSVVNGTQPLTPSPRDEGLSNGSLTLGYSLPTTQAYDIQACLMGAQKGPSTAFRLPPSIGGYLDVSLNGSTLGAVAPSATSAIPAWFELYAPRTYSNGTSLVSAEILAAQTQVFNLGVNPGQVQASLKDELNLRNGRYDLRAFVRAPSGLVSFDSPYLKVNGSAWISLDGCSDLAQVTSASFGLKAELSGTAASWPRELIMMYDVQGVESFGFSKVTALAARIDLGNGTRPFPFMKIGVGVAGTGSAAWDSYNGSVYLLATNYPLLLDVNLSFENVTSVSLPVVVPNAYWAGGLAVPYGSVNVTALAGGTPISNATILVAKTGSHAVPVKADGEGSASLALPPGRYNITLSQGGQSASEIVQVAAGGTSDVRINLSAGQPSPLVYLLIAVLVAAVAFNGLVWRAYLRRRSAFRGARTMKCRWV